VNLEIDEPMDVVALRVAFHEAIAVLVRTADKVAGHADVDRAARPTRKNVKIELPHGQSMTKRAGTSPAMTDERVSVRVA
jgi:hypothetical protein